MVSSRLFTNMHLLFCAQSREAYMEAMSLGMKR